MSASATLLAALLLLWSSAAFAGSKDACIKKYVPEAAEVGHGRKTFLTVALYDATLYARAGSYDAHKPFALTLSYLHDFKSGDIAKESVSEMKRLGHGDASTAEKWLGKMRDIFPDVSKGDEITGVYTADRQTVFCQGGAVIGVIKEPTFGQSFFGIWLDKNSTSATLRQNLLGKNNEKTIVSGDGNGS